MKGTALIYRPGQAEPEVAQLDQTPDLDFLKNAVGGYIELVPGWRTIAWDGQEHECAVFCNEEGKISHPPALLNNHATKLWHEALLRETDEDGKRVYPTGLLKPDGHVADLLVGDIVVVFGDQEFMAEL